MKIVWIGAGNLATCLGTAFRQAGHETLQVYSRTIESATALADKLGGKPVTHPDALDLTADVYIFSVKDAVLEELVARLLQGRVSQLCLHTAGSMPMDVFKGHASRYGVLYPMQTFSKDRPVDFRSIPCFIEASDAETLETIRQLAASVSGKVKAMSTAQRRYVHLAAVFACNFTNHCYALAAEILERQGLPFEVMYSLIDETVAKVHDIPPRQAQTGPALRYDENVIHKQLTLLNEYPELKDVYEQMSRSIHQLAVR